MKSNKMDSEGYGFDGIQEEALFKDTGRRLKGQQGTLNFTLSFI